MKVLKMNTINTTYRNKRAILFGFMLNWMAFFAVQTAEADDRRTDDGDVVIVGARTYYDDVINNRHEARIYERRLRQLAEKQRAIALAEQSEADLANMNRQACQMYLERDGVETLTRGCKARLGLLTKKHWWSRYK
jgi:hypothetical protein